MRIAVIHNLTPGGAKRALFEQVRGLARTHEIDVFAPSGETDGLFGLSSVARRVEPFGARPLSKHKSLHLGPANALFDLGRTIASQRALAARVDRAGYDLVFAHGCRVTQAPAALRWLRTPTVYYCQEPPRKYYEEIVPGPEHAAGLPTLRRDLHKRLGPLSSLHRALDRAFARRARALLCNSAYSAAFVEQVYGRSATVSYLGVDLEAFHPARPARPDQVLAVGSLTPAKGHDWALAAVAGLPAARRPRLLITSTADRPAAASELRARAEALGARLEILNGVSDESLTELYSSSLLTLCVALGEPFGFSAIESMACGRPVLAVAEGGFAETVVDGESGWLVSRDPTALARQLDACLRDPAEAARRGQQGRRVVEQRWSWERSVAQLDGLLARVAGGASPEPTRSTPVRATVALGGR